MVEETFIAPTPQEAFKLAKQKYGHFSDLKLIKAIQIKDENNKLISKITVSVDNSDFLESIGLDQEQELAKEIVDLKSQINNMKTLLSDSDKVDTNIEIVKSNFVAKGLSKQWLDSILSDINQSEIIEEEKLIFSYVLNKIHENIKIKPEDLDKSKLIMLIGSTGVGKTTTIAKLTARYALMPHHLPKIALVNLDSFRVGAYEQLGHYATQMQIKHIKVEKVDEFAKTLNDLIEYDVVLIDTAGISPYDTSRLIKTIEYLKNMGDHTVETSLVVSATAKKDDVVDIYEHFSFLNINSAILTKFDETKSVGELFSFLIESGIPVSYVSNGQNVPDDLEVASKKMLMDKFMEAFNV